MIPLKIWFSNVIIKYIFNKFMYLILCCQEVDRIFWEKLYSPDLIVESRWFLVWWRWPYPDLVALKGTHFREKSVLLFSFWTENICNPSSITVVFSLELITENFQHKPVFTHILFWAQMVGPSHTLQFPLGSLPHLLSHLPFHWKWWLETVPSVFFSKRTHIWGVQRQRRGSSDASQLPQPRNLNTLQNI